MWIVIKTRAEVPVFAEDGMRVRIKKREQVLPAEIPFFPMIIVYAQAAEHRKRLLDVVTRPSPMVDLVGGLHKTDVVDFKLRGAPRKADLEFADAAPFVGFAAELA